MTSSMPPPELLGPTLRGGGRVVALRCDRGPLGRRVELNASPRRTTNGRTRPWYDDTWHPRRPSMRARLSTSMRARLPWSGASRRWARGYSTSMRAPSARIVPTKRGKLVAMHAASSMRLGPVAQEREDGRGHRDAVIAARVDRRGAQRAVRSDDDHPVGEGLALDAERTQHFDHRVDAVALLDAQLGGVADARRPVRARRDRARARGSRRWRARHLTREQACSLDPALRRVDVEVSRSARRSRRRAARRRAARPCRGGRRAYPCASGSCRRFAR